MSGSPEVTVGFDHAASTDRKQLLESGAQIRSKCPIAWTEAHGGYWVTSRHKDIEQIARDAVTFTTGKGTTIPDIMNPFPIIPHQAEPPMHSHYRSAIFSFLTPRAIRPHEDGIRSIVVRSLERFIAQGGGDAIADFAFNIPALAMAAVFGLQAEDGYRFHADFNAVLAASTDRDVQRQQQAVERFVGFLREKFEERRSDPSGSDLVSAILRYNTGDRAFDETECLGILWTVASGGVDTTKHAIGQALYHLGKDPMARQRLIEDPALIPVAVEEILRLDPPGYTLARTVTRDVTFQGVPMKEGDKLLLVYGWANHDETVFPHPDNIDLGRKPNRHLAFGSGIHACVGMHLARMELRLVLEEVMKRIPRYRLVEPVPSPILRAGLLWGFESLPLALS
jgi:cytochrome P450